MILEGVPGVGKTFHINRLKEELGIEDGDDRFASVTFSPSIGTEEFIGVFFRNQEPRRLCLYLKKVRF